jgi:hypothetical protein
MATTGEECSHQTPLHFYFDDAYDLIFDAAIEHYCACFHEKVVPAQRCGTRCPKFQPIGGPASALRATQPKTEASSTGSAEFARVRSNIRQQLRAVCKKIGDNATNLEGQIPTRERRWKEADAWLSRPVTQTEALGRALAQAEQDLSVALAEVQRIEQQLIRNTGGRW